MTIASPPADPWHGSADGLLPLLAPEVERWMREGHGPAVEELRFRPMVAVAQQFDDLVLSVNWVRCRYERTSRPMPEGAFEAKLTVLAMALAAAEAAPQRVCHRRIPPDVERAFVDLWTAGVQRCEGVTAPQVAAPYLWSAWSPPNAPRPEARWEPAGLLLEAMAYKNVCHGLHSLANLGLPPLSGERHHRREHFNQRVVAGTQGVIARAARSTEGQSPANRSIEDWRPEERTLWEFLADVILGPGRPSADRLAGRPQPGAFSGSHLGNWVERDLGIMAGTIEIYFCPTCVQEHPEQTCPTQPAATVVATWRRHMFLTPRDRLSGEDRALGRVKTPRKVCKNPCCIQTLHEVLARCRGSSRQFEQQPIYDIHLKSCPYCRTRAAGQRPVTVWTQFP